MSIRLIMSMSVADTFNKLLLGGHWDLAPCMQRSFVIDFLKDGHVYVVKLEDGTIVAAAMWYGPGEPDLRR